MKLLSAVGDFWEKRYGLPGGKPVAGKACNTHLTPLGVSIFRKDEKGVIYRCHTVYMTPDSVFCPLYPLYNVLDLLPNGRIPFIPRVRYELPQSSYNLSTASEATPNAEQ